MQTAPVSAQGGSKANCMSLRLYVFFPTIMYYGIITAGGLVALPIGIISMELHGSCLLYGHVKWVKNTTFIPILDRPVPCHFVVSLQAVSSIIWGLCMAGYHTYNLVMEPESTVTVLQQLCFSIINIPTSLLMLVAACVTSDGYRHFCASLMKNSRIERCADGEDDEWRLSWWFKTREENASPKFAYYYQMAETAMWVNFGLWTMQAFFSTVPVIVQRRLLATKLTAVRYRRTTTARSSLTGLSSNPGSPSRRLSEISNVNYKFSIQVGDLEDIEEISSDGELLELPAISKREYSDSIDSEDEVRQSLEPNNMKSGEHESGFSEIYIEKGLCECSKRKGFKNCNTSTTLVSMDETLSTVGNSNAQLDIHCNNCGGRVMNDLDETSLKEESCVMTVTPETSVGDEKDVTSEENCLNKNVGQNGYHIPPSKTYPSISERMAKSVVEFTIGDDCDSCVKESLADEMKSHLDSVSYCRQCSGVSSETPGSWPLPRKAYHGSKQLENL